MTTAAPRTPADVLHEARARDSQEKRARVVAATDAMLAKGERITFAAVAKAADVSTWLVYAEGVREHIEGARKKQDSADRHEKRTGTNASAASLATDLELARAEIRSLREERDRLKEGMRRKLGEQVDQMGAGDLAARVNELTEDNRPAAESHAAAYRGLRT